MWQRDEGDGNYIDIPTTTVLRPELGKQRCNQGAADAPKDMQYVKFIIF